VNAFVLTLSPLSYTQPCAPLKSPPALWARTKAAAPILGDSHEPLWLGRMASAILAIRHIRQLPEQS